MLDLRIGFGVSLLIALIFVSLGAVVLHPRGVDLEGVDLAVKLSQVYTETVGAWTFPLFIGVAFVAIWGSYYANADGVPRMVEQLWNSVTGNRETRSCGRCGSAIPSRSSWEGCCWRRSGRGRSSW